MPVMVTRVAGDPAVTVFGESEIICGVWAGGMTFPESPIVNGEFGLLFAI